MESLIDQLRTANRLRESRHQITKVCWYLTVFWLVVWVTSSSSDEGFLIPWRFIWRISLLLVVVGIHLISFSIISARINRLFLFVLEELSTIRQFDDLSERFQKLLQIIPYCQTSNHSIMCWMHLMRCAVKWFYCLNVNLINSSKFLRFVHITVHFTAGSQGILSGRTRS